MDTETTGHGRRIARLFRPYRLRLGSVLALIALSAGLGMISPFLLRELARGGRYAALAADDRAALAA